VKKAAAILFLSIYLLSTTEAHQLLKLPFIFQHFAEHKNEDKNITFLHFLAIHYLHGSPRDADFDKDMQLPFKSCCDMASTFSVAFLPVASQVSGVQAIEIPAPLRNAIHKPFLISSYLSSIWQPPRFC